ncbi:HesA/MoeB/ThiF family protein [Yoonia sp. 208BN28-4]|uniref:HesA/MoeB/ThiF family protein n=1 Tax=Yoonia sp. 208BN28-4 TaxID=3126505 RepID=UPI0030A3B618
MTFSYDEMTTRNIGFVTQAEQDKLRDGCVFVCGTGGMGGAVIMALARMGVGHLIIADIDHFEVSNLNRQVFAFTDTVDQHKADATAQMCRKINPEMKITVWHDDWPDHLDEALGEAAIVVNGTDDLGASLLLYRAARAAGKTMVDAYAAPFPSVYVTKASDTPHEERLGYPTVGTAWDAITEEQRSTAFMRESEWVVIHSSSRHHIDLDLVGEVVAGRRSRMSFAPMVILTGQLMAYEAAAAITGKPHGTDNRGYFLNPYKGRTERPKPAWLAAMIRPVVRRFLTKLASGS